MNGYLYYDRQGGLFTLKDKCEFIENKIKELEDTFVLTSVDTDTDPTITALKEEGWSVGTTYDGNFITLTAPRTSSVPTSKKIQDMIDSKTGPQIQGANGPGNTWRN